jgi:hypothetical protein
MQKDKKRNSWALGEGRSTYSVFTGRFLFFYFLCTLFNTASSAALRFLCVGEAGMNPGLLQLLHWQSDVLTTRLDFIHT